MNMLRQFLLPVLFLLLLELSAQAQDSSSSGTQIIDDSIQSLEQVEQTLNLLNANIEQLNEVISTLESDSTASQAELRKQKDLRDSYQSRVKVLQARYEGLLKISEKLKSSLKVSETLNYVLAGLVLSELVFIIIQAVIKK